MLQCGVARTRLSPPWGVELAGWGYYLNRTWRRVRDHTEGVKRVHGLRVDQHLDRGGTLRERRAGQCRFPARDGGPHMHRA